MPRVVFIGMLALILATPTLTRAAIFAWHDMDGVAHYVDNLGNVPNEYRGSVVTFVKDWERAPAPAESVSPVRVPDAPVVPSAKLIEVSSMSFERGFREGLRSAVAAQPAPVSVPVGSIVQNVQIFTPSQLVTTFPFFGPVFSVPGRLHPRRAFAPRFRSRFMRGPRGRFVFGTTRPPSVVFFHR
jgi:hypothetical protein